MEWSQRAEFLPDSHRGLPQSLDSEKGVLCSALLAPAIVLPQCIERLEIDHFYLPAHQIIYREMIILQKAAKPVDFITLAQALKDKGELDQAGGAAAVSELFTFVSTASNADYYIDIVREKFLLRRLIQTCTTFAGRAYDEQGEAKVLLDEAEARFVELGTSAGGRSDALTLRRPSEIVSMEFDPADMVIENGYAVLGERTVINGAGGVGKSRLALQMARDVILGRDWLGWKTNGRKLNWLFLQTENSNRRLQSDLAAMFSALTPSEQFAIESRLLVHTLECDHDGILHLNNDVLANRVSRAINLANADIVVFDPLRDFWSGDLNSDAEMTGVCSAIGRIVRQGNPKRLPIIIHHAGTGKAGLAKISGIDRASFGRNSKVLHGWARAVINVGQPAPKDNPELLLIASGKCSNGPEFKDFVVRLDDETMTYSVDVASAEELLQNVGLGSSEASTRATEAHVISIVRAVKIEGISKAAVVKALITETGVAKTYAYRLIEKAEARGAIKRRKTDLLYVSME